jgi:HAD superfamily hydrolase (TIGR01509 family)
MIPYDAIETLFLDAGNTLVSMDFALLCDVFTAHGVACEPAALARAEAAARPAVSRFCVGDASGEWSDVFTFYLHRVLGALGGAAATARDTLAPTLAGTIRRTVPTPRLWSAVLPGVPDALARLRAAGITLVVVSNSDGTAEHGLAAVGLREHVHHVVDSALLGVEKPAAGIFLHALELAGAAPERTLHIGDLYDVDVLGARAAGVHGLLLDPYGDWPDVDCARAADVAAVADAILGARGG